MCRGSTYESSPHATNQTSSLNFQSTSRTNNKSGEAKTNTPSHNYSVNLGVHSKLSVILRLFAALFFSQRGLKAVQSQMFELAGEGKYNSFLSKVGCAPEASQWTMFQRHTCFSGKFYCRKVRREKRRVLYKINAFYPPVLCYSDIHLRFLLFFNMCLLR